MGGEEVTENVQRSKLSALKVAKQRKMNLMNTPTDEVVARRRLAQLKSRITTAAGAIGAAFEAQAGGDEAPGSGTRKMQLQVARKKAARITRWSTVSCKAVSGVRRCLRRRQNKSRTAALRRRRMAASSSTSEWRRNAPGQRQAGNRCGRRRQRTRTRSCQSGFAESGRDSPFEVNGDRNETERERGTKCFFSIIFTGLCVHSLTRSASNTKSIKK
ncbi:hypothetical protein C3747_124g1 [Trypanosoma cruzi]|uniref:Uncharacterized protein n=1 Tax=Trypanosoma cruzi TaxID=5693 RepID=A0A2V2WBX4_TRYCR|nr:hypothetical protein C3747_124g1 [Trypanosoma cruzi]